MKIKRARCFNTVSFSLSAKLGGIFGKDPANLHFLQDTPARARAAFHVFGTKGEGLKEVALPGETEATAMNTSL